MKVVVPRVAARRVRARCSRFGYPGPTTWGRGPCRSRRPPTPSSSASWPSRSPPCAGRGHAVLSTGLGPAFVLAASGGKSAAARAVEAAGRLNDAAQALRTTVGLNLEARGLDASPVIALAGRPEALARSDRGGRRGLQRGLDRPAGPRRARDPRASRAVVGGARARPRAAHRPRGEDRSSRPRSRPRGACSCRSSRPRSAPAGPACRARWWTRRARRLRDGLRLLALRVPASVTAPVAAAPSALPAAPGDTRRRPACSSRGPGGGARSSRGSASTSASRSSGAGEASRTRAESRSRCRS